MQPWWIVRLAEAGALIAVVAIPAGIWFVARLQARLKLRRRWGMILLSFLAGHIVLIGLGLAASVFFLSTHPGCNCGSGEDIFHTLLTVFGPIAVGGPVALLVWLVALAAAKGARPD